MVTRVTCFAPGHSAVRMAKPAQPDARLDLAAERPHGTFDLVLLLDVLEHASDDWALPAEGITSATQPARGGSCSTRRPLPCFPPTTTGCSDTGGATPRPACRRWPRTGVLEVVRHGQLFTSLLLRALAKLGETAWGPSPAQGSVPGRIATAPGSWHHRDMLTSAVAQLLALDAAGSRLPARLRLPLPGLSTWVLARRR